jgi:glutaredoxin
LPENSFVFYPSRLLADKDRAIINKDEDKHSGATPVSDAKQQSPPQVTFYTKAGCHLCEEARDMLDDIAALTQFELTEIDIRSNMEIFERYRYRIPVIIVNDDTLLEGRINFQDLAAAFHLG